MPAYWLLKTEPEQYSFDQLVADRRTGWDGIANNLALQNLRKMRKGDRALIYHTGNERAVIGIAEVISNPYQDPEANDKKRMVVKLKPVRKLPYPVPLIEIKNNKTFKDFELVKNSRLSVMPVKEIYWKTILGMGGL
jgi:predicted RNA-binding protein with PUA-like domain